MPCFTSLMFSKILAKSFSSFRLTLSSAAILNIVASLVFNALTDENSKQAVCANETFLNCGCLHDFPTGQVVRQYHRNTECLSVPRVSAILNNICGCAASGTFMTRATVDQCIAACSATLSCVIWHS